MKSHSKVESELTLHQAKKFPCWVTVFYNTFLTYGARLDANLSQELSILMIWQEELDHRFERKIPMQKNTHAKILEGRSRGEGNSTKAST